MTDLRYLRSNLVDGFSQEVVQKLHFAVVGCGAVGNEVVKNLTLLGVGKLDVFDFDTIEIHNLTRSVLFRESDIGKKKAQVVADRAMELDPHVIVTPYAGDFWTEMTLDMLKGYDAVISCVDNFEARIRLNRLCALFSKNLINTGIDSRNASVEVYPLSRRTHPACYHM
jgi:molybdopterin/thiamine biosynthesis adenylyltransferase